MVIQISDDILKKAQDELFINGSALRDLSMCSGFDKVGILLEYLLVKYFNYIICVFSIIQ
jgi:hypothetical protein